MVRALRSRRGGSGARSAVVSALLRQETPDHSSIWRFRPRIEKLGLPEKLLAEVNRQLDARGLIVKRGTLVDATIIAAAVKPPSFEEGVVSERDPDASFTMKNGETHFGYKAHLTVDEESGLVRQAEIWQAAAIAARAADRLSFRSFRSIRRRPTIPQCGGSASASRSSACRRSFWPRLTVS